MNRACSATGWVRNPIMKSPDLDPTQASSYELGWTLNPITGCLNGCSYCYARRLAHGRLKSRYLANQRITMPAIAPDCPQGSHYEATHDPFYPRFWEDRLLEIKNEPSMNRFSSVVRNALRLQRQKGIFVCDMSDLFGIGIPEAWTWRVLEMIISNPQHRFYLLTKQPQNLIKFSPFPENCWVGVSITNYEMARRALPYLAQIEAKVKYVSYEPLLEMVPCGHTVELVDWVIIGAQTGPGAKPPMIEWVEEIVEAADQAGVPVFLKDNLLKHYPELPRRQEIPTKEVKEDSTITETDQGIH